MCQDFTFLSLHNSQDYSDLNVVEVFVQDIIPLLVKQQIYWETPDLEVRVSEF